MINNIPQLYKKETSYWRNANRKLFGITAINEKTSFNKIQEQLDKDCEKYWNGKKKCRLALGLENRGLNSEIGKQTPNSYKLRLNFYNMQVEVLGEYNGKMLPICSIPTPSVDLTWIINNTHYTPRVASFRNYSVRKVEDNVVIGEGWKYFIEEDTFECTLKDESKRFDPTIDEIFANRLSANAIMILTTISGDSITKTNFKEALKKLPIYDNKSIFNYCFSRLEYFEQVILDSGKYASPTKKVILNIGHIVSSQKQKSRFNTEACLVLSKSKIYSLENFRTVVNIYNNGSDYKPAFTYTDTNGFFDSFKTTTTGDAGRNRLLLDNIVINDNVLWVEEEDGTLHNMYEYIGNPPEVRLSCLSSAPFCSHDKPKRIMMNAKMSSQAVPLNDELDDITHRIKARVGFTDIEGYSAADSIVISQSFADRLITWDSDIIYTNKNSELYHTLLDGQHNGFTLNHLSKIYPTKNIAILICYENVRITKIDDVSDKLARVFLKWDMSFRLGDKLTNLHGAKGTVGKIMPDDEMPRLLNKVGNMEPGPLDIIISGFSTIRRGSLGQIFEAWALATDYDGEEFIISASKDNLKEMKEYSENSVVEYKGVKQTIPVGYNYIMRLHHHACTKVSVSPIDSLNNKFLNFGEMENLNLVANDCNNILKELALRSPNRYFGSHYLIKQLIQDRKIPESTDYNLQTLEILKTLGYRLHFDTKTVKKNDFDEIDMTRLNNVIMDRNK